MEITVGKRPQTTDVKLEGGKGDLLRSAFLFSNDTDCLQKQVVNFLELSLNSNCLSGRMFLQVTQMKSSAYRTFKKNMGTR